MARGNLGSAFIVATGDPEKGRGYRLSQARSLAAKRQHQSHPQRRKQRLTNPESIHPNLAALEGALKHIPPELHPLITPPPLSSLPIGYKRMQDFVYQYTRYSQEIHPFFSTVIYAAVTHPALMSAKILNASTWDDLSSVQKISDISLQQGLITRRLLSETMESLEAFSDVTVIALITIILFDLITEDEENLERDQMGFERILQLRGSLSNAGLQGYIQSSKYMIDLFKWALKIGSYQKSEILGMDCDILPQPAEDMSVFTFRPNKIDSQPVKSILQSLYQTISHSRRFRREISLSPSDEGTFESSLPHPSLLNEEPLLHDTKVATLMHANWLFRRWSNGACDSHDLINPLLKLKELLLQTDLGNFWGILPGALIWCVTIGVRLCPPSPLRKWFIMQLTRSTCVMGMTSIEAVLRSLQFVLEGLDGGERNRQKPVVCTL